MLVRRKISARTAVDRLRWTERVQGVGRAALLHEDRGEPGVARRRPRAAGRARPARAAGRGRRHWSRARPRSPTAPTGLAEHEPDHVRQLGRVAPAGADTGTDRRPARGSGPQPVTAAASRAAPVGVHISSGAGPPRDRRARLGEDAEHGGGGTGITPCPLRAVPPEPSVTGPRPAVAGRARADRRRPRPRRRSRRARRPRGSGRRRDRTRCTAASARASRANASSGGDPHRLGGGVIQQVADVAPRYAGRCSSAACTSTLTAADPVPLHRSARELHRLGRDRVDGALQGLDRHAGVDERAEQHVAAGPGRAVEPADHRPVLAGHPGREQPGAEAVVDVHHDHAGRAGVEHREQRGNPAERGPVAHAGRHRDQRHARQPADRARQRTVHAGDDDQAVRSVQARRDGQQPVNARPPRRR